MNEKYNIIFVLEWRKDTKVKIKIEIIFREDIFRMDIFILFENLHWF